MDNDLIDFDNEPAPDFEPFCAHGRRKIHQECMTCEAEIRAEQYGYSDGEEQLPRELTDKDYRAHQEETERQYIELARWNAQQVHKSKQREEKQFRLHKMRNGYPEIRRFALGKTCKHGTVFQYPQTPCHSCRSDGYEVHVMEPSQCPLRPKRYHIYGIECIVCMNNFPKGVMPSRYNLAIKWYTRGNDCEHGIVHWYNSDRCKKCLEEGFENHVIEPVICPMDPQSQHFKNLDCTRCNHTRPVPRRSLWNDNPVSNISFMNEDRTKSSLSHSSSARAERKTHWCRFRMKHEDPTQKCSNCLQEDFKREGRLQPKPKDRPTAGFWKIGWNGRQEPPEEEQLASSTLYRMEEEKPKQESLEPDIKAIRLNKDKRLKLPKKGHGPDAGYDIQSTTNTIVPALSQVVIGSGWNFRIPEGWYGKVEPKSGLALSGISVLGGVIDSGFEGEVKVIIINHNKDRDFRITAFDWVAQIVFKQVWKGKLIETQDPGSSSTRGKGGFGSTGINAIKKITKLDDGKNEESKFTYKIRDNLKPDEVRQIHKLFRKFKDILATSFEDIRGSKLKHEHDIDIGDAKPIKRPPYPIPYHLQEWTYREIDEMVKAGIIAPTKSDWSHSIVIVGKKAENGETAPRMVIDYRPSNAVTIKDAYPIPRTQEILEQMQNHPAYFTSLDLFSGFHQIGMTPRAQQISAFVTPRGQYKYLRMPFGLCNAPATFQRVMNDMFKDMIGKVLFVYIDDITIYTQSFKEHMEVLEEVLRRIRENGMFLKPKKCTIASEEIHMLGHIINSKGIKTDPAKISAVKNYPAPQSKTEVRAFMGLVGYYRHFIPACSEIAEPINRTLKKNVPYQWTDEAQSAFEVLKDVLTQAPILARPDMKKPFRLHTDASKIGLGAVLTQDFLVEGKLDKNGKPIYRERVISYASRSNHGAEQNYGATQLEQLAVVWAVEHYRHYLIGNAFQVVTDHQALKSLMKMKDPKGLYARWIMKLLPYDLDMVYKPGKKHTAADALSRRPYRIETKLPKVTFKERLIVPDDKRHNETY